MAGLCTRATEKEPTSTRDSLSSANCLKVFPERTACSSTSSALHGQSKPTGHIAAASESPCYSLLPEEPHANEEIFCNLSRRPHLPDSNSISPCRRALPDLRVASRRAERKEKEEGHLSPYGYLQHDDSPAR